MEKSRVWGFEMAVTQRKKNVGNLIQVIYYRAVIARASVFENFMRGLIQESARLAHARNARASEFWRASRP